MRKYKTGDIVIPTVFEDRKMIFLQVVGSNEDDYFISPWMSKGTTQATRVSRTGLEKYYKKLTEEEMKFLRMLML